jgi:hypothetical protein
MGAGGSIPDNEEDALEQGIPQDEIDAYKTANGLAEIWPEVDEEDADAVDEDEGNLSDLEFDADGRAEDGEDGDEGLFSIEDTSKDVDNFMAIKPWIGALVAPSDWDGSRAADLMPPPTRELALQWVHGYRTREARRNVCVTDTGEVLWPAAAVAVLYDEAGHTQRHFQGHSDDILCLAIDPSKQLVATGGIASKAGDGGKEPEIIIWQAADLSLKHEIRVHLPSQHRAGVTSCTRPVAVRWSAFSCSLCTSGSRRGSTSAPSPRSPSPATAGSCSRPAETTTTASPSTGETIHRRDRPHARNRDSGSGSVLPLRPRAVESDTLTEAQSE